MGVSCVPAIHIASVTNISLSGPVYLLCMKVRLTALVVFSVAMVLLCQCSATGPGGRESYPLIEKKVVRTEGKTYVFKRYLVCESPRETLVVSEGVD